MKFLKIKFMSVIDEIIKQYHIDYVAEMYLEEVLKRKYPELSGDFNRDSDNSRNHKILYRAAFLTFRDNHRINELEKQNKELKDQIEEIKKLLINKNSRQINSTSSNLFNKKKRKFLKRIFQAKN